MIAPSRLRNNSERFGASLEFQQNISCCDGLCAVREIASCQGQMRAKSDGREQSMSAINGDKSRFHRERKEKIARRLRNREQFKNLGAPKPPVSATGAKQKEVSA
jgi:hypothetical protein